MVLKYDRQITISTANSRYAENWPAQKMYLSELVDRLKVPMRSQESLSVYLKMPKAKQDNLKDVGGFVGGELLGGRRKNGSVKGRDFISLDLDSIPAGETDTTLKKIAALGCGCCVYSTRKHEPSKPRLRALVWLDRTCSADEYEAISRKLAEIIGIQLCDPSTFQPTRLMYWPSCCSDSQYVYEVYDNPFLSVDGMLRMYQNWRNVAEWPQVPGAADLPKRLAAKQGDPTEKTGIVGAFCRIYDIYRAFELIPGIYEPCTGSDRYTYVGGSTSGGAVIYDGGKFLYSHHATDPCGGRLVNAFDLIRIHKFGELDDSAKADTPVNRLPSYTAMTEFAVSIPEVSGQLTQERYATALQDFSGNINPPDSSWMKLLTVSPTTGLPAKTADNVLIILEHDPALKGKFGFEEFSARNVVFDSVPWDPTPGMRIMTDVDDAGIRHYMEKVHGITGKDRIADATQLCLHNHTINVVQSYLNELEWDRVPRIDTLLIDYFGAEDTAYNRETIRKSLVAAVARAYYPGTKHDEMLIIVGQQGTGKSTFLRLLGKQWFSDSQGTFEGKEALELIQGRWIIEVGELQAMRRSEVNTIKLFLSKTEDIFREAYGRRTNEYPRRCVFFGTTNDAEFLRDATGDRRFWPVDVGTHKPKKSVWDDLPEEVDQIWAEAVAMYRAGERLTLSARAAEEAIKAQQSHKQRHPMEGIVRDYLSRRLPQNWDKMGIQQRRVWLSNDYGTDGQDALAPRTRVCAVEVWTECYLKEPSWMKRSDAMDINAIIESIGGWSKCKNGIRFGPYGFQRGYTLDTF